MVKAVCGHTHDDFIAFRRDHDEKFFQNAEAADDGRVLYVKPVYYSLYFDEDDKVDEDRVRDNHHTFNLIMSGQNTSELDLVPNDSLHPWKDVVGLPNIQMLPLDSSEVKVIYVKINTPSLSNTQPVADAASRVGVQEGLLNVYIGVNSSNILGQAERPGNVVYVHKNAVGGFEIAGALAAYAKGKTFVHEFGHAAGLTHVFDDKACDNKRILPDIPEQIRPNYDAFLTTNSEGQRSQANDNRAKDRVANEGRSCIGRSSSPETDVNEMATSIMGYGNDDTVIMFTKSQVTVMRNQLLEGNDLILFDANGVAQTSVGGGLTTMEIIFIAIGGVLFIVIVSFLVYRNNKKKRQPIGYVVTNR